MRYKAIFGCACLGWIVGWAVAPRLASEFWPPFEQIETSQITTPKGRVIPGTKTTVVKSAGQSAVDQFAPIVGAVMGALCEIAWQRKRREQDEPI
jgi:hypothetical protein